MKTFFSLSSTIFTRVLARALMVALTMFAPTAHAGLVSYCLDKLQMLGHERDLPLVREFAQPLVFTDEQITALRAAVDWAQSNELSPWAAVRQAIVDKSPHAYPLLLASNHPREAANAVGTRKFGFGGIRNPAVLFKLAMKHGAPRSLLYEILMKGVKAQYRGFALQDPYLLLASHYHRGRYLGMPAEVSKMLDVGLKLTLSDMDGFMRDYSYTKVFYKALTLYPAFAKKTVNSSGQGLEHVAVGLQRPELVEKLILAGSDTNAYLGAVDQLPTLKLYARVRPEKLKDAELLLAAVRAGRLANAKYIWKQGGFDEQIKDPNRRQELTTATNSLVMERTSRWLLNKLEESKAQ